MPMALRLLPTAEEYDSHKALEHNEGLNEYFRIQKSPKKSRGKTGNSTRCPFYDDGERFSCDMAMNNHDPALEGISARRIMSLRQHLAKSKSTMWFIGDSLSGQYFDVFSCAMFYISSDSKDVEAPMHTSADGCREFDGQFQLCYISAGTAYSQDSSVKNTISALSSRNALTPGSLIIANEGIWWRGTQRGVDEEARIKDFNVDDIVGDRRVKVFWRETLAQHFPSEDGTFHSQSWYNKKRQMCVPVADSTKLAHLNKDINDILYRSRISVIPGFDVSLSASSAGDHLEMKTSHCKKRGSDCTHWCTPSKTLHHLREVALVFINDWIETQK